VDQAVTLTVVVLADTHLRTGSPRWLPDTVIGHIRGADAVLHAGDVLDAGVLERLRQENPAAPVHAVLGNNDTSLTRVLPGRLVVEMGGVRIGMVHDSGSTSGRAERLHRWFPHCQVVVFGHSHAPVDAEGAPGQLLFNPGSPTQRRAQPVATFGVLRLARGRVEGHAIHPV
jgi:putative phosphoesterase